MNQQRKRDKRLFDLTCAWVGSPQEYDALQVIVSPEEQWSIHEHYRKVYKAQDKKKQKK